MEYSDFANSFLQSAFHNTETIIAVDLIILFVTLRMYHHALELTQKLMTMRNYFFFKHIISYLHSLVYTFSFPEDELISLPLDLLNVLSKKDDRMNYLYKLEQRGIGKEIIFAELCLQVASRDLETSANDSLFLRAGMMYIDQFISLSYSRNPEVIMTYVSSLWTKVKLIMFRIKDEQLDQNRYLCLEILEECHSIGESYDLPFISIVSGFYMSNLNVSKERGNIIAVPILKKLISSNKIFLKVNTLPTLFVNIMKEFNL
jgi:hypothetical protein